jgi:hypothetical protein
MVKPRFFGPSRQDLEVPAHSSMNKPRIQPILGPKRSSKHEDVEELLITTNRSIDCLDYTGLRVWARSRHNCRCLKFKSPDGILIELIAYMTASPSFRHMQDTKGSPCRENPPAIGSTLLYPGQVKWRSIANSVILKIRCSFTCPGTI